MKVIRLLVPVFGLAAWPSLLSAGPLQLQFTSDWMVAFQANAVGAADAAVAFGNSATKDDEKTDLAANPGVAKAQSSASSVPIFNMNRGQADVFFQRGFRLPGDANWSVTLAGLLTGTLSATSPGGGLTAQAVVQGEGIIRNNMGAVEAVIGGGNSAWFANLQPQQGTETLNLVEPLQTTVILPSGDYTLIGSLETVARADPGPPAAGQANADFFHSLSIGVNATPLPVPEPASVVLLMIGFGASLVSSARRQGFALSKGVFHKSTGSGHQKSDAL
jgi:PEP-CTERM motif